MRKIFICIIAGLLFVPVTGCGPRDYVEPEPIKELDIEGVPPLGDETGGGSTEPADGDN
ncbi:MAG: hypothetical protein ACR2NP_01645 [Pirellulaceae bacterium]